MYIGTFFIARTGSKNYTNGMVNGTGIGNIAERDEFNNVGWGIEADFYRARKGGAFNNQLIPGIDYVGGFILIAPGLQIDSVSDVEYATPVT